MKAIQITMEEKLLERLDAYPEAGRRGRSAVVREAVADYLARKESEEIDLGLERAYGPGSPPDELEGWAGESAIDLAYEAAYSASPLVELDDWPAEAASLEETALARAQGSVGQEGGV